MSYSPQAGYAGSSGEPPLDHPWYGIGFVDAVKRVFTKYATFTGRASRGEFWWWVLANGIVFFVLYGLGFGLGFATTNQSGHLGALGSVFLVVLGVYWLATIVPSIALAVRRLHDAGYSGLFYLLGLIPGVGGLIVIVLCAMGTSPQAPKYGPPEPRGWNPPGGTGDEQSGFQQGGFQQGNEAQSYPSTGDHPGAEHPYGRR